MDQSQTADLSKMFPDWVRATATREGDVVTVALMRNGGSAPRTGLTLRINLEAMYQGLHDLRALGPQTKQKRAAVADGGGATDGPFTYDAPET